MSKSVHFSRQDGAPSSESYLLLEDDFLLAVSAMIPPEWGGPVRRFFEDSYGNATIANPECAQFASECLSLGESAEIELKIWLRALAEVATVISETEGNIVAVAD